MLKFVHQDLTKFYWIKTFNRDFTRIKLRDLVNNIPQTTFKSEMQKVIFWNGNIDIWEIKLGG